MVYMITGGSKNGKSRLAEQILLAEKAPYYYIATMRRDCREAEEAIARHRALRHGKGFQTIERYTNLADLHLPKKGAVLLECLGNLCANEIFHAENENPVSAILEGIKALIAQSQALVLVTNEVGMDGISYSPETTKYQAVLSEVNRAAASLADCVLEAVFGIPCVRKGELPPCLRSLH